MKIISSALCESEDNLCFEHNLANIETFSPKPKIAVDIKPLSQIDWEITDEANVPVHIQKYIKSILRIGHKTPQYTEISWVP